MSLVCHHASCFRRFLLVLLGVALGVAFFAGLLWYRIGHVDREALENFELAWKIAEHNSFKGTNHGHIFVQGKDLVKISYTSTRH